MEKNKNEENFDSDDENSSLEIEEEEEKPKVWNTEFIKMKTKLGEGGFAKVYLGYEQYLSIDKKTTTPNEPKIRKESKNEQKQREQNLNVKIKQYVAIKVISKKKMFKMFKGDEKRIKKAESLQRSEMKILGNFSHENIIQLLVSRETKNEFILVLEYCDITFSTYLSQVRQRKRKKDLFNSYSSVISNSITGNQKTEKNLQDPFLDEDQIRFWMLQFCKGIRAFSKHHYAHRDLKPDNLMIKHISNDSFYNVDNIVNEYYHNKLKIIDFGFSKMIGENEETKTQCGTTVYMAPEVVRGKAYTSKTDLWSVGVIMYQTITGQIPFCPKNIVKSHKNFKSDRFSDFLDRFNISNQCKHLLKSLMEKDPKKRIGFDSFFAHPFFREKEVTGVSLIKSIFYDSSSKLIIKKDKIDEKMKQDYGNDHKKNKPQYTSDDSTSDDEEYPDEEKDIVVVEEFEVSKGIKDKFNLWFGDLKTIQILNPGTYLINITHKSSQMIKVKISTTPRTQNNKNQPLQPILENVLLEKYDVTKRDVVAQTIDVPKDGFDLNIELESSPLGFLDKLYYSLLFWKNTIEYSITLNKIKNEK